MPRPSTATTPCRKLIRESYEYWRDGCRCLACQIIDSYERGDSELGNLQDRFGLLVSAQGERHGDGVWLGQLSLWPPSASQSRRGQ